MSGYARVSMPREGTHQAQEERKDTSDVYLFVE